MTDEKQSSSLLFRMRGYFITGLLVLAPTAVSIWVIVNVFQWFDNILGRWYAELFATYFGWDQSIPGLGAVTLAIIVIFIGMFARLYAGRQLFAAWERIITYVPLINRIYIAVRQLSDSFAQGGAVFFKRPVMLQYPRQGLYSIGFVTRDCDGPFCRALGRNVSTIFVPTTPNPTSGVLIFAPSEELIPLNMSVEDAMKLIISAGVVTPDIHLPEV